MDTINVNQIIKDNELDVKTVANELFPGIKHPKLALDRILKGEAFLDSNQISRLSILTGIPIEFLFTERSWKPTSNKKGIIDFSKGDYRVELNLTDGASCIYHKNKIFHEQLIHSKHITLSEYIKEVERIIESKNK